MGCEAALPIGSLTARHDPVHDDGPHALADSVHAHVDEALAASYRAVFDGLDAAFCVIEMVHDDAGHAVDYRFVDVNRAFDDHTGLVDVVGRSVREVLPDIDPSWIRAYDQVARSGEPIRFGDEVAALGRWFDTYAWPLGPHRVAVHVTDVTTRKFAQDEHRYRSEQVHALIQQAPIGVYLVDADFRILEVNPTARPAFGDIPDLIGRDYEEVLRILWPDALADEIVRISRRTLLTGASHHEREMAGVRVDRSTTEYYDWQIDRIRLPDGTTGIVCYFSDITHQVGARHALAVSENRYRTLFESIDEGFCIVHVILDDDGRPVDYRFVEVNPAFVRHTGLEHARGRLITELVPDIEPSWIDAFGRVALTGEPARFCEHSASMGRWFDDYVFRIGEPHDHKVAVLFNDVSERKRAEHALQESVDLLRHHAHHDALTGLPNRVLFEDRLGVSIADAERHGRAFALLYLDLDGFKAINDTYGHACGDAVLVEVARRLRGALRASDTLARMHGDEFVAILSEVAEAHEACALAQKLRAAVREPIAVAGTTARVQASIGVARFPDDGDSPHALLRAADAAMYVHKQASARIRRAVARGGHATPGHRVPS